MLFKTKSQKQELIQLKKEIELSQKESQGRTFFLQEKMKKDEFKFTYWLSYQEVRSAFRVFSETEFSPAGLLALEALEQLQYNFLRNKKYSAMLLDKFYDSFVSSKSKTQLNLGSYALGIKSGSDLNGDNLHLISKELELEISDTWSRFIKAEEGKNVLYRTTS